MPTRGTPAQNTSWAMVKLLYVPMVELYYLLHSIKHRNDKQQFLWHYFNQVSATILDLSKAAQWRAVLMHKANRLWAWHQVLRVPFRNMNVWLVLFSLTEKSQQVSGFILSGRFESTPSCMEGHRTEIILLGCGSALKQYSIFRALLECFQDHHDTTTSVWVVNMSLLQTFLHCLLCIL